MTTATFHPGCSRSIVPLVYSVDGRVCMESESACVHGDTCMFRLVLSHELSKMGQHMQLSRLPPMIRCSRSIAHCIFCFRSSVDLLRIKDDMDGIAMVGALYTDHAILGPSATGFVSPVRINPSGMSIYIDFYSDGKRVLPPRVEAARILLSRCSVDLPLYSVIIFSDCSCIYMIFTKSELSHICQL